jgi:hypothetical protein
MIASATSVLENRENTGEIDRLKTTTKQFTMHTILEVAVTFGKLWIRPNFKINS